LPVDFFSGSAPDGAPGNGLFGGSSAIGRLKIGNVARESNFYSGHTNKNRAGATNPAKFTN
jgi:hypothetical protein